MTPIIEEIKPTAPWTKHHVNVFTEAAVESSSQYKLAAESDATWESNRSAPIPATSPTLSPTLSAITQGCEGRLQEYPIQPYPTRSAAYPCCLGKNTALP